MANPRSKRKLYLVTQHNGWCVWASSPEEAEGWAQRNLTDAQASDGWTTEEITPGAAAEMGVDTFNEGEEEDEPDGES